MRAVLIANSHAGQRRRDDLVSAINAVAADLVEDQHWTNAAGEARGLAAELAASGRYDAIFVAGGDGTINEVANGVMSVERDARPAIGILPFGTCNVLANELAISTDGNQGVRNALEGAVMRSVDVGRLADRCFLLMAGFGFDAAAVQKVTLPIKGVIGATAYLLSAIATLADYKPSEITLHVDDDVVKTQAYMVLVANVSSYAYRQMKLAPFASIDDGWLDVCVFEKAPAAKVGFVTQAFLMMAHRHLSDPRVRYYRARRVEIESTPPMPGQIDGEAYSSSPVTIEIEPKALNFLVPASTRTR